MMTRLRARQSLRVALAALLISMMSAVSVMASAPVASGAVGPLSSKPVLVSMGDSFASGEANPPFDRGTNDVPLFGIGRLNLCHRSASSAARLLGATASTQIACSGAVIDDVVTRGKWPKGAPDNRTQIAQLNDLVKRQSIDAVTISLGGNDLKFADIVAECFIKFIGDCLSNLSERLGEVDAVTTRLRDVVYPAIRQVVRPQVPILVVGYPRLFPPDRYGAVRCGWLSVEERRRANQLQDRLESSLASAVRDSAAQNIKYVSMLDISAGHELCTEDSWFYPVGPECKFGFDTGSKSFCAHPLAGLQSAMEMRLRGWTPRRFDASKLGCGPGCVVTGQIMFKHPAWGFVTLVTTIHNDRYGYLIDAQIVVVDRNDQIRYRSRTFAGIARDTAYGITSQSFGPVQSFPDTSRSRDDGNLFIAYNPGRYNGIITLRPTTNGFSDFGSIPPPGEYSGTNYNAVVVNTKKTAVVILMYVCYEPACTVPQIMQWTGSNYVGVPKDFESRSCPPMTNGGLNGAWIYRATIGCDVVARLVNNRRYERWYLQDGFVCVSWNNAFGGPDAGTYFQCAAGGKYVTFQYI